MRPAPTFTVLSAAILALAGCGGKQETERQDTAGGEILARSIGDDMLPYDTVRSQPPLAPKPTASRSGDAQASDDASTEGDDNAPQPDPIGEAVAAGEAGAMPAGE
ncbi:MAG: hypothetical protein R3E09_18460 [Novosphingobium sp.]|nr:hypothetical protein [Novosphingobium sp.]